MDQTNSLEPLSKDGVANIANPSTQNANTKISIFEKRRILSSLDRTHHDLSTYMRNLQKVLEVFEYPSLRPNQVEPIVHLLKGQDLLLVSSTSSGKSFCYIAPALAMGYKTVVFFPLVALIQDQWKELMQRGVRVGVISSGVSLAESNRALAEWEHGALDFLFVAPERLQNKKFLELMDRVPPDFIVVDEIHCAYEQATSFRSSYKKIAPFVERVCPKLFLGQTATMSDDVERSIREIYNLKDTPKLVKSYPRPNLHFRSVTLDSNLVDDWIFREINKAPLVPSIVYCSTINMVEDLYHVYGPSVVGGAMMYTGKMSSSHRKSNQTNFINGNIRVAFATNAFGMGINKADIGKIIIRSFPGSLEELIQEFGRGGRNGCDCDCILIADYKTLNVQLNFISNAFPDIQYYYKFFKALKQRENPSTHTVEATLKELADAIGVHPWCIGSISEALKGFKIIDRADKPTETRIKFLNYPDDDTQGIGKKFLTYKEKIDLVGIENPELSCYDVDLEYLAEELGLSSTSSVSTNLKNFKSLGLIDYQPPPRSAPIKIIGDMSLFNKDKIAEEREKKKLKLDEVKNFVDIPDSEKSQYLDEYFETHS